MEPVSGSLRKRYNLSKLVEQLTAAGAPAISLNSDGVLFGGSMVDIAKVREASDAAAVAESLNASDGPSVGSPTLPPYQLYKLRLVVGALEGKGVPSTGTAQRTYER